MSSGALPGPDLLRVIPRVSWREARGARVRAWRGSRGSAWPSPWQSAARAVLPFAAALAPGRGGPTASVHHLSEVKGSLPPADGSRRPGAAFCPEPQGLAHQLRDASDARDHTSLRTPCPAPRRRRRSAGAATAAAAEHQAGPAELPAPRPALAIAKRR